MFQKLILKRLSFDDLTLFKFWILAHNNKQANGIGLSHNVLINELFPSLPIILENKQNKVMITINIYGPGLAPEYSIQRKIQKRGINNYCISGEFIADPENHSGRFHILEPGDLVIFDFVGDLEPNSARAVFVAKKNAEDAKLHEILEPLVIGSKSMISLQSRKLERLIASAHLSDDHPANFLILEDNLEDAALGGGQGIKALRNGPFKGKVSRQTLLQAKKTAQRTGRLGEELVFSYLELQKSSGLLDDFQWDADENAISPYDFSIQELDKSVTLVEVKTTKGNFSNRIHISYNELLQMKDSSQYNLYRVFDIVDDSAQLRIASNVKSFAENIIELLQNLPFGTQVDGISLNPSEIAFSEAMRISFQENEK
ncbi:MAG: DUF3883 domain-containing protein [Ardenticatenaceae bacterium]|nr:DUF3883 domain-containing protein [Ardenticatenaceae bacterium]MCB9443194.1 DUF3883 domain-containing protein [Ardenticatenaceae bacterium]